MSEPESIGWIINNSVNDVNYDSTLKLLTPNQIRECLKQETRKTSIKKLETQLKKLVGEDKMSKGYKKTFEITELKEIETKKDGETDIKYKTKLKDDAEEPTTIIIVTSESPLGVELKDELELRTVNYQKKIEDKK